MFHVSALKDEEKIDMFLTRELGRKLFGPSFDYILFLRPRQWPILTCQLAVGILCAPAVAAALGKHPQESLEVFFSIELVIAWMAWVVCLNGGTLAFNSAYDRDEDDIAYLARPPQPPQHLALISFLLMLTGAGLAFLVTPAFGLVTLGCVLMSIIYSHPIIRCKSIPGCDLAINMIGYGCGTTISGIMVGQVVLGSSHVIPYQTGWLLIAGFGLLFGSFYPLTQIYQVDTDRKHGDLTLAVALGTGKSLALAIMLGIAAAIFLLGAARQWNDPSAILPVLPLIVAMIGWTVMLAVWYHKADGMDTAAHENGMYIALTVWAVIDGAVLISRYGGFMW